MRPKGLLSRCSRPSASTRAPQGSAEVTGTAVVGHPIVEVEEASKRADLVILGAHTGSKLAGSFFGTRAVKIAAVSHCPVAVIPLHQSDEPKPAVVVGVDGSEGRRRPHLPLKKLRYEACRSSLCTHGCLADPGLEYLWSEDLVALRRASAEGALPSALPAWPALPRPRHRSPHRDAGAAGDCAAASS